MTASDRPVRYLIVSLGRTGTTLLGSILGQAGGDFGMPTAGSWDPTGGANEFGDLTRITVALERAENLTARQNDGVVTRFLARMARSVAKRKAVRLLSRAPYTKASAFFPAYAFKLGYSPRVIASYRRFGPLARSKMLLQRTTWPRIARQYETTFRNALLGIHTFGGCAISYEELVDPAETAWADALAGVTGLDRDRLLRAREDLGLSKAGADEAGVAVDPDMDALYLELRALKGVAVPPSDGFLRY